MRIHSRRRSGFTLIELMIVVAILAMVAVLLLPLIQKAQVGALANECRGKAIAIGKCVFTYTAGWNGWTCPDGSFYVKELGHYPLSYESGYDAAVARTARDYLCPVDENTIDDTLNGHGYPTSYTITNTYVGVHLGRIRTSSSDTLLLIEIGKTDRGRRHPKDRADDLQKHYVFGDGRGVLGWDRGPLPGLACRWWADRTTGAWALVKQDNYLATPDHEDVWTAGLQESNFGFLPRLSPDPVTGTIKETTWGRERGQAVEGMLVRMDGYIQFPTQGDRHIISFCDDRAYVWIDLNRNEEVDGNETGETTANGQFQFLMTARQVNPSLFYQCTIMYHESTGNNYLNLFWSTDPLATTDPQNAPRELIPGSALSHIP